MGRGGRIAHQNHPVAVTAGAPSEAGSTPVSTGGIAAAVRAAEAGDLQPPIMDNGMIPGAPALDEPEPPEPPSWTNMGDVIGGGPDEGADEAAILLQRAASLALLETLDGEHQASQDSADAARDRREQEEGGVEGSYTENPELFQAAYEQARERVAAGQQPVPYMTENATGGLGAREGGRGFGLELEFDFPSTMTGTERALAINAIGRDLHAAGLSPSSHQQGYHASERAGYSDDPGTWRLESDSTVAGEIVSPIMYDEPGTWENLARVCEIVRRHGGRASARTGGHIHVGLHDYDHTVENHNRLMHTVAAYEDVLYRLAQNPERGEHRGTHWCRPNMVPTHGYADIGHAARNNNGHNLGINMQSVRGRTSDHVEFRMWDGSLEPAVIQTQIKASLGLADYALRTARSSEAPLAGARHELGSHRRQYGRRRHAGERWRESTRVFRHLADNLFTRGEDRAQLTALFAATRWQGLARS